MIDKMRILFVCTGNKFRSMSAELLMNKFLEKNRINDLSISSSGTNPNIYPPYPDTIARLKKYGCDASKHQFQKISEDDIKDADIIICMAKHHQEYIKINFRKKSFLFNEIAYNKEEDVVDDEEYARVHGWDFDLKEYINKIVDYIHDAIPEIYKNLGKFINK